MRVLHVLAPARVGGLERVVHSLAVGLRQRDCDVHVAPVISHAEAAEGHPFVSMFADDSVPVHPVLVTGRAYNQERQRIAELCAEIKPDIVHTHGYRSDIIDAPVGKRMGASIVTTVHGFTGGDLRNRIYEYFQVRAFRSFDAVIAVSSPLHTLLSSRGVGGPLRMIRNAAPIPAPLVERTQARQQLSLGKGPAHIAWIGRLSREKGADVLIDALALTNTDVHVTFIGDGPERTTLEQHALRLGLNDRIHFAGNIMPAAPLLPAFDAFVLSSRTEGTPMVLFEAMEARIPIVATRVGGVPDVVNDATALLVPSQHPRDLAAAIDATVTDRNAARLRAAAAYERLTKHFSLDHWITQHHDLYRELRKETEVACSLQPSR